MSRVAVEASAICIHQPDDSSASIVKEHEAAVASLRTQLRDAENALNLLGGGQSLAAPTVSAQAAVMHSSEHTKRPWSYCNGYVARMRGVKLGNVPHPPCSRVLWTGLGSFLGIMALNSLHIYWALAHSDLVMIIGSFGAQAVLVFGAPHAPLAQPWNCIFGNTVSAFAGVTVEKLFVAVQGEVSLVASNADTIRNVEVGCQVCNASKVVVNGISTFLGHAVAATEELVASETTTRSSFVAVLPGAFAVCLATMLMQLTLSLHPPGGATALIATTASKRVKQMGYLYMIFPVLLGTTLLVAMGALYNNMSKDPGRVYPVWWLPRPLRQCWKGRRNKGRNDAMPEQGRNMHNNKPQAVTSRQHRENGPRRSADKFLLI